MVANATDLQLTSNDLELTFHDPQVEADAIAAGTSSSGWKVTTKRGNIAGVGASVSGSGAWVKLKGSMSFTLRQMEKSETYQKMKSSYSIAGGVTGFWAWIGFGANASKHKSEIQTALHEMKESQTVTGTVHPDLYVTGEYPNVQVDASAYVLVLQITDDQGSTVNVFSNSAPGSDVGAQDGDGNNLPTRDNESTITI